jgi:hypothetical protein
MQKVEQIVGILPRRIEADAEVDGAVLLGNAFEALPQEGIASGGLGEREFGGSRLEVVVEEDGIVAVAGGVDADAEAAWRWRSRCVVWYHRNLEREPWK